MAMDSRRELDDLAADLASLQRRLANAQYLRQTERASDLQAWVNFTALSAFSGERSKTLPSLQRTLDGARPKPSRTRSAAQRPAPQHRVPTQRRASALTPPRGLPRFRDPRMME